MTERPSFQASAVKDETSDDVTEDSRSDQKGCMRARIQYFIGKSKQDDTHLPQASYCGLGKLGMSCSGPIAGI